MRKSSDAKNVEDRRQRLGIVVKRGAAIGKMGDDQLDHERLEAEIFVGLLLQTRTKTSPGAQLGEVLVVRVLALADKLQVHRHAGHKELAGVLRNRGHRAIRVAVVQDRDDVDLIAGRDEVYRNRIGLGLDLFGLEVGERLLELLGQPVDSSPTLCGATSEET